MRWALLLWLAAAAACPGKSGVVVVEAGCADQVCKQDDLGEYDCECPLD